MSKITVFSELSIRRNFSKMRFVPALSENEKVELKEKIHEHIKANNPFSFDYIDVEGLDRAHFLALAEEGFVPYDFIKNPKGKALLVNHKENFSVTVNEEDHLTFRLFSNEESLSSLYQKAKKIDDFFDDLFPFAFSERLGFLTASPENLGTALRVNLRVHLPAIAQSQNAERLAKGLSSFGISLRKIKEGDLSQGSVFSFSNAQTLGITEEAIIETVEKALFELEKNEDTLRGKILESIIVRDRIFRAYGILKEARILSSAEAAELLSLLRMGALEKLIGIDTNKIDNLILKTQKYNVMLNAEGEENALEKRAEIIRNSLS